MVAGKEEDRTRIGTEAIRRIEGIQSNPIQGDSGRMDGAVVWVCVWAPYPTSLIVLSDTHMREREGGRFLGILLASTPYSIVLVVRVVTVGASTSVLRANGSAKRRPCPLSANPMDRSNYCVHDVTNYWSMRNAWHGMGLDWRCWDEPFVFVFGIIVRVGRPAVRHVVVMHARMLVPPSLSASQS